MAPAPDRPPAGEPDDAGGPADPAAPDGGPNWWLRLVIVLAVAIPLVVEGGTLLGMVGVQFGPEPTETPTPTDEGVGLGDELLDETEPSEEITDAVLDAEGRFTLTVRVVNTGASPYELRLGNVTTGAGTIVPGDASTGTLAPGQETAVAGRWVLPIGERPATIQVVALVTRADGSTERLTETVELAPVPRRG